MVQVEPVVDQRQVEATVKVEQDTLEVLVVHQVLEVHQVREVAEVVPL